MLTITGYSCEVFGVRNICRLRDLPSFAEKSDGFLSTFFSVEVLFLNFSRLVFFSLIR